MCSRHCPTLHRCYHHARHPDEDRRVSAQAAARYTAIRGTSPGLRPNHCDTASLLGQHMRRFKLHTVNDGRFQKRRRGRGNRPCESSLPQEAQGKARFLEERQDLERLPSGGRMGQSQGHPGPGLAAGWEPGHKNTYIEFFELFLNLAVHLNGIKSWMPNRKRFNKQQCSIGPDF